MLTLGVVVGGLIMWTLASRVGVGQVSASNPRFIPLTFRTGSVSAARFAPDGETVLYSAAWGGEKLRVVHDATRQCRVEGFEYP